MKHRQVSVDFGRDNTFEFRVDSEAIDRVSRDEAVHWFDEEFVALECDLASPTGKVLSIDRVLSVAKYSGAARFQKDPEWGARYALYTLTLLRRDVVRVDVANDTVGS